METFGKLEKDLEEGVMEIEIQTSLPIAAMKLIDQSGHICSP